MNIILKLLKINLPLWVILSLSIMALSYIALLKYNNYSLTSDIKEYKSEINSLNLKINELTSSVESLDVKFKTKSDELELSSIMLKSCYARIDEISNGFQEINNIMNQSDSCICDVCLCDDCNKSEQDKQTTQIKTKKGITVETNKHGIQFLNKNFKGITE